MALAQGGEAGLAQEYSGVNRQRYCLSDGAQHSDWIINDVDMLSTECSRAMAADAYGFGVDMLARTFKALHNDLHSTTNRSWLFGRKPMPSSVAERADGQHHRHFDKHAHHCCQSGSRASAEQGDCRCDSQFEEVARTQMVR